MFGRQGPVPAMITSHVSDLNIALTRLTDPIDVGTTGMLTQNQVPWDCLGNQVPWDCLGNQVPWDSLGCGLAVLVWIVLLNS